jgi:hypothetical protein
MTTTVILQPQLFPWKGVFEQMRVADWYLHFVDVAPPQGRSFLSRVQILSPQGKHWLTLPIQRNASRIQDIRVDETQNWKKTHLTTLAQAYARAPFRDMMLDIVRKVYARDTPWLAEITMAGIEEVREHLKLPCQFDLSSRYPSSLSGTERLVELCQLKETSCYVTGRGALNYLRESAFLDKGINVQVMDYQNSPYPQHSASFDPYVSVLDLIAQTGPQASTYLTPKTTPFAEASQSLQADL